MMNSSGFESEICMWINGELLIIFVKKIISHIFTSFS